MKNIGDYLKIITVTGLAFMLAHLSSNQAAEHTASTEITSPETAFP